MSVIFRCLDSLLRFGGRYQYEVVVIDNQSTDGSYEKLRHNYSKHPQVRVYRNTKNGCSSGRNLGVQKSTKDYLLFLDSDQWVTNPYWLDAYFDLFEAHRDNLAIGWGRVGSIVACTPIRLWMPTHFVIFLLSTLLPLTSVTLVRMGCSSKNLCSRNLVDSMKPTIRPVTRIPTSRLRCGMLVARSYTLRRWALGISPIRQPRAGAKNTRCSSDRKAIIS